MDGRKTHIREADKMRKTKNLRRRAYNSSDRALRTLIFKHMASADVDGKVFVANMDAVFKWIKGPGRQSVVAKGKPKLTVVKADAT